MKKKAGQGQGGSKPSEVRSTALVPVQNTNNKPAASKSKSAPAAVKEEPEFDYKSLGKISSGDKTSKSRSTKSGKKSGSNSSANSGSAYGFSNKKSKKKNPFAPIIAIAAAVILVAGAVAALLYYTGVFEEKVEVTLADGTVTKITTEEAYAELATDKFYAGTVINGIDVGGMTYDEALNAVTNTVPDKPLSIDIRLSLAGKLLYLDFSDATFEYNTKQILDEAYAMYRPAPLAEGEEPDPVALVENYNNVQQLKNTPLTYETAYTVHIESVTERINKVLGLYVDEFALVKDATIEKFDTDTHEFVISPEKTGYAIDVEATAKEVKALFDSKVYTAVVEVPTEIKEPQVTEAMIRENFGLMGDCSTSCSNNSNRNSNISQACDNMNGTILAPGEVFSFNQTVGERTAANGFKEATVILGGQYEQGLGGGICQASTTLYNAVLEANLAIVERNNHAWPSDYVQTGLDATVDWPALDFKFKNDTDYQVVIVTWFDWDDRTVNAEIYGQKLPDGQYIEIEAEITSMTDAGPDEYVEDRELPVGQTKTIRQAHQGITAKAYKVWYNSDGEEIDRVYYNTTTYYAYGRRIGVGVLNPDGTYATMDKNTGEITSPIMTTTPVPTPTPEPTATPAPTEPPETTPAPTDPPPPTDTPVPTPTPEPDPPTDPPAPEPEGGGGEGGEGGGGEATP